MKNTHIFASFLVVILCIACYTVGKYFDYHTEKEKNGVVDLEEKISKLKKDIEFLENVQDHLYARLDTFCSPDTINTVYYKTDTLEVIDTFQKIDTLRIYQIASIQGDSLISTKEVQKPEYIEIVNKDESKEGPSMIGIVLIFFILAVFGISIALAS